MSPQTIQGASKPTTLTRFLNTLFLTRLFARKHTSFKNIKPVIRIVMLTLAQAGWRQNNHASFLEAGSDQ